MMKFSKSKPNTFAIEILRVGTWNKTDFKLGDLEAIAQSFNELSLSGRVPVGLGHERRDTESAEGWIVALRVEDDVLTADVEIVRDELIGEIKAGKWRNVSVELMKNVKRGKHQYSWVLIGLAILGAAPPAVHGLRPLNDSVAPIVRNARSEGVLTFSHRVPDRKDGDDGEDKLKKENARLVAELIDSKFNAAIETGRIMPRDRQAFTQRYGDKGTVAQADAWIASTPKPAGDKQQTRGRTLGEPSYERPDEELSARATKLQKDLKAEGVEVDLIEATKRVLRADPTLAERYASMPSDLWGGG